MKLKGGELMELCIKNGAIEVTEVADSLEKQGYDVSLLREFFQNKSAERVDNNDQRRRKSCSVVS